MRESVRYRSPPQDSMEENQKKVNEIARKIGFLLLDNGVKILQSAFKDLKPTIYSYGNIASFCQNAGLNVSLNQFDYNYFTIDWDTWQLLIDLVILDKAMYIGERRDCDNYAFLMSSLASFLTRLNTFGASFGTVYNKDTGRVVGNHYFNIIVASGGNLYLIDSLNSYPDYTQIKKGQPIILGSWRYEIGNITFF